MPLRSVTSVKQVDKALQITLGDREILISSFWNLQKRDEAYAIALHLWKNPFILYSVDHPVSVQLDPEADRSKILAMPAPRVTVDTTSGARALQNAQRAQQLGIETLVELDRQKGVVDGMNQSLNHMEDDLEKARRHLRGIESVGGAIANKMQGSKSEGLAVERGHERKLSGGSKLTNVRSSVVVAAKKHPDLTFEIVYKHKNDSLSIGKLELQSEGLVLSDGGRESEALGYDQLESVVCRARPLHVDLMTRGSTVARCRFLSSFVQMIVNELVLRGSTASRTLPVVFERGSLDFAYNNARLRELMGRPELAARPRYADMHPELAEGLRIQDEQLDAIGAAARTLQSIGKEIGDEADRSMAQLKGLHSHVDSVHADVVATNRRVEKLL